MHIAAQSVAQIVNVLPQEVKTARLFPGLIASLLRIHVQDTGLYFWILSARLGKFVSLWESVFFLAGNDARRCTRLAETAGRISPSHPITLHHTRV